MPTKLRHRCGSEVATSDPVTVYLDDHFAGSAAAVEILETLRSDTSLGSWATALLGEIEADGRVLRDLRMRVGESPSLLKEGLGWLVGALSRLKLQHEIVGPVGKLEALETLALGIQGKLGLWRALQVCADSRLAGTDYDRLCARARGQFRQVEDRRFAIALAVLSKKPANAGGKSGST
jgi:hypothetical protein